MTENGFFNERIKLILIRSLLKIKNELNIFLIPVGTLKNRMTTILLIIDRISITQKTSVYTHVL